MIGAFSTHTVAARIGARVIGADAAFYSVCIDSRRCAPGSLFVALPGSRVDGHAFVAAAATAGAAAALVRAPQPVALPQLVVEDAGRALGELGAMNRERYQGPVVAITGSCGKTTTRALLAAVLAQAGETLATEGNYNNELGVPLTLMRLERGQDFAVIEMGAAGLGHIDYLCRLAQPTVSVLLNAMPAHLQGFGSLEGVAQGKAEIYDHLGAAGVAVINMDQPWAAQWAARARAAGASLLRFSAAAQADRPPVEIYATEVSEDGSGGSRFRLHTPAGTAEVRLRLPGAHNVGNALAAAAAAHACGVDAAAIARGLAGAQPVSGRLVPHALGELSVLDDCYNANPGSVRAAIDLLAGSPAPRVLALGMMAELGEQSASLHREAGAYARERGLDALVGVGDALLPAVEAFGPHGHWFESCAAAGAAREQWLPPRGTVLIKGSRSAGMERLLDGLLHAVRAPDTAHGREHSPC